MYTKLVAEAFLILVYFDVLKKNDKHPTKLCFNSNENRKIKTYSKY